MPTLKDIRGVIIDMDGVIWRGREILPGVSEFFELLQSLDLRFIVATNNSTVVPERVTHRFAEIGIVVEPEQVLTSSVATTQYMLETWPDLHYAFCIGEDGLRGALQSAGYQLTKGADGAHAVVVGFDHDVNWSKLEEATLAIVSGARFIGTNPDPSIPTERGLAPGNGAILAALKAATQVEPTVIGKPEPHIYLLAMERMHIDPELTLVLGDRLETDILGGQNAGMRTSLVLTGVTRRDDLDASSIKPDWVFEDLPHATRRLAEARA